jgi:hypothetical protein
MPYAAHGAACSRFVSRAFFHSSECGLAERDTALKAKGEISTPSAYCWLGWLGALP